MTKHTIVIHFRDIFVEFSTIMTIKLIILQSKQSPQLYNRLFYAHVSNVKFYEQFIIYRNVGFLGAGEGAKLVPVKTWQNHCAMSSYDKI